MSATEQRKKILITESSKVRLTKISEDVDANGQKRYTFTGPCAEFGVENENDRYYSKQNYLDKIAELQEEIEEESLLGEMDHNEDYAVSMKQVSHKIVKLWYDETTSQVMITIQLIPTDDGKNAMAIADSGTPLFISSRASGYIDDDGKVTLEKIYTYDIVYRPGFRKAKLKRLNESYGIKSKSIAIYEWREESSSINTLKNSLNMEYATKDDLNKLNESLAEYSKGLTAQIDGLKKILANSGPVNETKQVPAIKSGKAFGTPTKVNEGLENNHNPKVEENDEEEEIKDKIDEIFERLKDGEVGMEAVLEFMELTRDEVNGQGEYLKLIQEFVNKLTDFTELIASKVNKLIIGDEATQLTISEVKNFATKIATRVNENTEYSKLIATRVNEMHKCTNKQANVVNENFRKISESLNVSNRLKRYAASKINENKNSSVATNASGKKYVEGQHLQKVNEAVDSLKKKSNEKKQHILEGKYPFFKHLTDNDKMVFIGMPEMKQKMVASAVNESRGMTKEKLSLVVSQVNSNNQLADMMSALPQKLVPVWESLSVGEKNQIISLYKIKSPRDIYERESFWESVDFGNTRQLQSVNENLIPSTPTVEDVSDLGYDANDIDKSLGF